MEKDYSPEDKLRELATLDQPDIEEMEEARKALNTAVRQNIGKAQVQQKKNYDQKHGAKDCFTVGSEERLH